MNLYFKREEKLRNELKLTSLEDHNWSSSDQDGTGVVKFIVRNVVRILEVGAMVIQKSLLLI